MANNMEQPYELYKKYRPTTWEELIGQERVANSLRAAVKQGKLPTSFLFSGPRGTGKDLHKDTIIPTPSGFTTMGKLAIGDYVIGSNGKPTKVTNKYCPMDPEIYEMAFSDGTKVKAGSGHLWVTSTLKERAEGVKGNAVRTTKEIAESLTDGEYNHSVQPLSAPAQFSQVSGNNLDGDLYELGKSIAEGNYPSIEKSQCLLFATVDQRMNLIRGFMDSAGAVNMDGAVSFASAIIKECSTIGTILNSMGWVVNTASDGESVYLTPTVQVFTIADKAVLLHEALKDSDRFANHRLIISAEKIEDNPEDYFCISVESSDQLFLCTDSFLPTHNTSSAFVLAKAVNCENLGKDGNPCNKCETCVSIDEGNQPGVTYQSMANKGSVDDVRELVKTARLNQPINRQVFILDEIHNISKAAFDALLIPLEEKTMPALFIFCTTEVNKLPAAFLSRVQSRKISLVPAEKMRSFLHTIMEKEGLELSENDLENAIRSGRGSVRDTLSALDSIIAIEGEEDELSETYGARLLEALASKSFTNIYGVLADASINTEADFRDLAEQLFEDLRNLLLKAAGVDDDVIGIIPVADAGKVFKGLGGNTGIVLLMDEVGTAITQMAGGADSRIALEYHILKGMRSIQKMFKAAAARA